MNIPVEALVTLPGLYRDWPDAGAVEGCTGALRSGL